MSANAKQHPGAMTPTAETNRDKLAKIKEVRNSKFSDYPFEVHSLVTKECLARFTERGNAESFIANISLEVLQRG